MSGDLTPATLVELDDARGMVEQAETFVAAMRAGFMPAASE